MKKHIAILSMMILALCAVGCKGGKDTQSNSLDENSSSITQSSDSSIIELEELEAPNGLALTERVLTWNAVTGATGYVVEINETEYEATTATYTLPDGVCGILKIRVKATNSLTESEYSEIMNISVSWKLPAPQNLLQEGNTIRWDAVDGAPGYVVYIDNLQYSATENYYVYDVTQPTTVKVLARGNEEENLLDSDYSEELALCALLATPTTRVSGTVISWDTVQNASGYAVYVDGVKVDETQNAQYDLKYLYVGDVEVCVKALSSNEQFADSAQSTPIVVTLFKETLATPANVRFDGVDVVVWNEVAGADGYVVFNNGTEYEKVAVNYYTIPAELKEAEVAQLQIQAISALHDASALSASIDVGKVSERNPLEIKSAADFNAMAAVGHYQLMNDIELTVSSVKTFKGTLNGNGYKIKGLTDTLFEVLDGAKIKNLTIENANVNTSVNEYGAAVGVLANTLVGATLENCQVNATLTVVSKNSIAYVGGIAGVSEHSAMTDVTFNGNITTSYCTTGGLVGYTREPLTVCEFAYCAVTGSINVVGGQATEVGGFIGKFADNMLTVRESKTEVEIDTNASYCGGFVGYMGTGKIIDCYALGSIVNTHTNMAHIGGFIGRLEGYNNQVTRCISMVSITAQSAEQIKVGGFVGSTVTGTYAKVYTNCLYDTTLADIDRVGNASIGGKGDGISAKTTEELKSLSYENGYDVEVWSLGANALPALVKLS